ncbi:hypothetical protein ABZ252_26390 [Streptomyces sp. NPDC006175]|uniref:hypothetical protein n=1 Tax=Streptomyces sp. NPDC006175 TaxID=3154471 RepID=UPI0033A55649
MHPTLARPPVTRHELLTELVSQAVGDDRWLTAAVSLDALENDGELARSVLLEAAERLATSAKTADPADLLRAVRKAAGSSVAAPPVSDLPRKDDKLGSLRRGPELDLGALVDALGFLEVTETR